MAAASIHLVILLPLLIFAVILSKAKGAALIASYNTMSDKEKAQYDEVALCKFMGKIMYGISFSVLLFAVGEFVEERGLYIVGTVLMIALIIFALVYTNTNNRFKKNGS
ncbi:DUF3784 domain-containing protein [Sporosarcina sp. ACRSL]|uniref:DUF3784 domain-containing protein n=1 Tax=Sporosarcina sp. ACRSL TaxID=2918215 RepID=UPI001EF50134|nr:DUF3784 domain-containing protein [Sporosarcina sp. ACRSL]MCG7344934.1 DUF3784 domain-containing protein [Sporosarcina sp. ACRSL]